MSRRQGRPGATRLPRHRVSLLMVIPCTLAICVSTDLRAERLPFQTYNHSSGLAHDRVRCVVADSRGFLWFCTTDGLSRFDGSRFVNYGTAQGLPHASVEDFVEVGPGVYWVATIGGLAQLRSDSADAHLTQAVGSDSITSQAEGEIVRPMTTYSLGSDAGSNLVFALRKGRSGRLWIGTANGLFVLERSADPTSLRRIQVDPSEGSPLGQVRSVAEAPDGTLWIGTLTGLFRRDPDGKVIREPAMRSAVEVRDVFADQSGRIWIGHDGGLTVFVPPHRREPFLGFRTSSAAPAGCDAGNVLPSAAGQACRVAALAELPAVVRSFSEDSEGRIWIGSLGGLVEFDGRRFRAYSAAHGLSHSTINAVAEDQAGNLWIGTDAGGVSKLLRHGFVSFKEQDGLSEEYVTSISLNRGGRVRVRGLSPKVHEFDGERFTRVHLGIPGELRPDFDYDVVETKSGDIWIGAPKGLFRFPAVASLQHLARTAPKAIYTAANGLPADRVAPVFADSRGDLWLVAEAETHRRVVRWERTTDTFREFPETDVRVVPVVSLTFTEDRGGDVWFGSTRGLARHRNGRFSPIQIGELSTVVQITGLHADPSGRLWVGTRGAGLYRTDDPTAERPRFTAYTAGPQGLSSSTVWCMTHDKAGYLYVGTAQGVDRLDPETGRFKHFTTADGLAGSEVIAAFADPDGALWFGTFTGVSRLIPSPDVVRDPPTVWIGGLRIRGVSQPLSNLGQPSLSVGPLKPDQNQLQIDYFGLARETGVPLTYQYRLEGADSAWTPPTVESSVNYAELGPGSYRFLVRAIDKDGRASEQPAWVAFTILRPVWQRWWFICAAAALAIASGYGVHTYRVRRLLETERLRTRIASDLHDDLGSSLSQISILSEVLHTNLGNPATPVADALTRIAALSRDSVDAMSDIVWAIDPARDTPIHLIHRMRRVAGEILGVAGLQLQFESSGDARPHLNPDVRHHVFLIFKESLNNVVRHAEASTVSIGIAVAPQRLHLCVIDDGRGFEPRETDGHGLKNMHRRAADLGGTLEVMSQKGSGTRVTLTVPLD